MQLLIIFFVTLLATFLSSMSGGGASAINLPAFLMLGIPFPLASSIQKWSSTFWTVPAAYNYLKGRKVDWAFIAFFSVLGLVGVFIAVSLMLTIDQLLLKRTVGVLILVFVAYTYFHKELGLREAMVLSSTARALSYAVGMAFGFYEGIFGAGNAIAFTIFTVHTRGYDFTRAMGHYYAVSILWELVTAILLVSRGVFNLSLTVPAVLGGVLGGFLGSKLAVYKGNLFVKNVFIVIGGLLGLRILFGS